MKKGLTKLSNQQGFLAVVTVVMVSAITLTFAVTLAVLGINESLLGYTADQSQDALQASEACSEEAYFRLKRDSSYTGGTIPLGSGTCTISISGSGSTRTINTSATEGDFTREVEADVTFQSNIAANTEGIDLTHWEEQ